VECNVDRVCCCVCALTRLRTTRALRVGLWQGTELGGKKRGGGAGEDEEEQDPDMAMFRSKDDR
jgi:hypothetical protein